MQVIVGGDYSGQYTIDSNDFWSAFGWLIESGSDDLLQLYKSKEVYTKDWKGQNGKQYDLSRRFFDDKIATLSGYLIADDEQDFWAKYLAFWDLLKAPGSRSIYSHELKQTFAAFYLDSPNPKRLTQLVDHPGKIAMKLDIQFQVMFMEFEPPVNVPRPPIVNAGGNKIITLPTNQVTVNNASVSPRGGATIVSMLWEYVSGAATPNITGGGTLTPTFTGLTAAGVYNFKFTATDSNGLSASNTMSVTVNPAAALSPPLINTGGNKTIKLPTTSLTISGASVTPRSGSTIAYMVWELASAPTFATITNGNTLTPTISGMTSPGAYVLRLTGEDSNGLSSSSTMTITVTPADEVPGPVVSAGGDRTIHLSDAELIISGASVTLAPGATTTFILWGYEYSEPNGLQLSIQNGTTLTPRLYKPGGGPLAIGVYHISLAAGDSNGKQSGDEMTLTVVADDVVIPSGFPYTFPYNLS